MCMKDKKLLKIAFYSFAAFLLMACSASTRKATDRYVVVLSMDGFRSDYPDRANTPTLDSLAQVGVKSSFRPSFPSLTFPNHYSMATGLYPDHHGIVSNYFYAPDLNKTYDTWKPEDIVNSEFYGGEPVWVTAEKQGIKSATFYWVGSETNNPSLQPSFWKKFDKHVSFSARADSVIEWLSLPEAERPHLVMWYIDEPDGMGHKKGTDAPEIVSVVEELDKVLNHFFTRARTLPIFDKIDFIIVSDHGMATYTPEQFINLYDYLPIDSFEYVSEGVPALLYPKSTYLDTAYARLKQISGFTVWKKEEVPAKYMYGSNPRIGDLVLLPDMGNVIVFRKDMHPEHGGTHGYDNFAPEMEAIFYAAGPSFKQHAEVPAMANVNLYPLITTLLDITPAENDGDMETVKQLLR